MWGQKKFTLYFLLFFICLFAFQNCENPGEDKSKINGSENEAPRDHLSDFILEGGGDGYEGKIYLEVSQNGCPDLTKVKARLRVTSQKIELLRENCQDLSTSQTVTDVSVQGFEALYQNRSFQLEAIIGGSKGVFTYGLELGSYAPAIHQVDLGEGRAIQAIPWGENNILIVQGIGNSNEIKLFQRSNNGIALQDHLSQSYSSRGYYIDPIMNMAALSDEKAILFLESYKDGQSGIQTVLIERNANRLKTLIPGPFLESSQASISGHPIDSQRMIITYPGDGKINYQVLKVANNAITLGPRLTQPQEVINLASNALNSPAFLSTSSPNEWLVAKSNAGLEPSTASLFYLKVEGDQLSVRDIATAEGFGDTTRNPIAVGSTENGALLIQSSGNYFEEDYSWASFVNGQYQYRDVLGLGDLTQEWVGVTNLVGSQNLMVGNVAFARFTNAGDDRMVYMVPKTGQQGYFNIYLPKAWQGGTGKFFRLSNELVFVEAKKGKAKIVFLSIPSQEELP